MLNTSIDNFIVVENFSIDLEESCIYILLSFLFASKCNTAPDAQVFNELLFELSVFASLPEF